MARKRKHRPVTQLNATDKASLRRILAKVRKIGATKKKMAMAPGPGGTGTQAQFNALVAAAHRSANAAIQAQANGLGNNTLINQFTSLSAKRASDFAALLNFVQQNPQFSLQLQGAGTF